LINATDEIVPPEASAEAARLRAVPGKTLAPFEGEIRLTVGGEPTAETTVMDTCASRERPVLSVARTSSE